VVFDELVKARTNGAAALMSEASRLYTASGAAGINLPEWTSLGAATVRTWVGVAHEARRIHGRAA
jgi:hypothetical protein